MGSLIRIVIPTLLAVSACAAIVFSELRPAKAVAEPAAAGTPTAVAVAVDPAERPEPVPTCAPPGDRISGVEALARLAKGGGSFGDWVVLNNRGYNYERGTSLIEPETLDFEARRR